MQEIKVIVRKNEDGLWAEIPKLPGCYSQGSDLTRLQNNLNEAVSLHLEGLAGSGEEIPAPFKGVFEFRFIEK